MQREAEKLVRVCSGNTTCEGGGRATVPVCWWGGGNAEAAAPAAGQGQSQLSLTPCLSRVWLCCVWRACRQHTTQPQQH